MMQFFNVEILNVFWNDGPLSELSKQSHCTDYSEDGDKTSHLWQFVKI